MSSATVSSAQTPSFYSMNGTMRLNGTEFASGLDTQSLIKALTANISSQIDKQKQLEQKAEWRRDAFRAVEDLLQKFSDTYFSYSTNSPLNIMSKAFFDSEDLISSNSSIVSATGAQSDAGNVVIDKIGQLATAATYTGGKVSNESIDSTEALGTTISAGSYLNLKLSGKSYTISLGKGIDTANPLDTDGHSTTLATALQQQLQAQINANSDLKDIVSVDVNEAGTGISLTGLGAGSGVTITGASQNFIKGLGFSNSTSPYTLDGSKALDATSLENLGTQLDSTTLTVQLDGLSKTITFDGDESQYNTPDKVRDYLQGKMDTAFGKDSSGNSKVNVTMSCGKLSLTTPTDPSSVLQFTSSSKGVLGYDGLLHIRSGETNRLELDKTLDELNTSSELNNGLVSSTFTDTDNGKTINGYEFVINGKKFDFDKSTELNTVINTINDDTTANVTISYSQTLNRFRIVSDDTGTQENISIGDEEGNLASALFSIGVSMVSSGDVSSTYNTNCLSTYNLTLSDGTQGTININGVGSDGTPYASPSALAAAVQTSVDGTNLKGHVTVGVSADGNSLTFETSDSSIEIAKTTTNDILGIGGNAVLSSSAIVSGNVTPPSYQDDNLSSTYQFTLNGGSPVSIDVNGVNNPNYTINNLKADVQSSIDSNSTLAGHVTVGVNGGKLTFTAAADSTLSIAKATGSSNDILGFGSSNLTTNSADSPITSGDVTTLNQNYQNSNLSSKYQFTLDDGTNTLSDSITVNGNSTNPNYTLTNLATDVQASINSSSTLTGHHITVGVSADGKSLTFNAATGSLSIKKAADSSHDILGFGTTAKTTSTLVAGKDLSMSVELGGTKQDITRSTNSFTLDGITMHVNGTLNANGVTTDSPIKFSSSNNVDDLYKKISDFVDKYNEIVDKINTNVATMPPTQSTGNGGGTDYEPLTDDQKKTMTDAEITDWNKKAQQGLLFCDPQMSALQTDIRTAMEGNVDSVGMSLAAIGISTAPLDTTSGGKLIISTDKLKDMLKSDPDKVAQLFTNADGIASRVKNVVKKNIGEFGNSGALFDVAGSSTMIGADSSEIGMDIADYDKNIKDLQTQLKDQQDSLQAKFTNMEMIISQLSSQYNYMSSMASS